LLEREAYPCCVFLFSRPQALFQTSAAPG
jgi:hypothetical protein